MENSEPSLETVAQGLKDIEYAYPFLIKELQKTAAQFAAQPDDKDRLIKLIEVLNLTVDGFCLREQATSYLAKEHIGLIQKQGGKL